jgi:SMC interacting uncharacterized protein involved in chromosome segregation
MSSGADNVNRWIDLQEQFKQSFLGMKRRCDGLQVENDHLREQIREMRELTRERTRKLQEELRGHLESEHNQLQHIVNHLEEECGKEKEKMRKVLELTLKFEEEFAKFNSGPAKDVAEFRAFLTRIITSYLWVLRQTFHIRL